MVARFIKILGKQFSIPDLPPEPETTIVFTTLQAGQGISIVGHSSNSIAIGYGAVAQSNEIVIRSLSGGELKYDGEHWYAITSKGKRKRLV